MRYDDARELLSLILNMEGWGQWDISLKNSSKSCFGVFLFIHKAFFILQVWVVYITVVTSLNGTTIWPSPLRLTHFELSFTFRKCKHLTLKLNPLKEVFITRSNTLTIYIELSHWQKILLTASHPSQNIFSEIDLRVVWCST